GRLPHPVAAKRLILGRERLCQRKYSVPELLNSHELGRYPEGAARRHAGWYQTLAYRFALGYQQQPLAQPSTRSLYFVCDRIRRVDGHPREEFDARVV